MVVGQLIKDTIPPLRVNDTGERALALMDVFQIDQLPLLHGKNYLGLISRNALHSRVYLGGVPVFNLYRSGGGCSIRRYFHVLLLICICNYFSKILFLSGPVYFRWFREWYIVYFRRLVPE